MSTTIGQSVHLSNCDDAPAAFSNARIEGADAGEFAIVSTPDIATIAPNGKASWLIVLSTKSVGLKHAEFVVDYDGGTARTALDGEGLGDDVIAEPGGPVDEISYYSCSAGYSTSRGWPLVLVLGIVLRRRRRR
jgi:MYXO-CTERM domain-containing protein